MFYKASWGLKRFYTVLWGLTRPLLSMTQDGPRWPQDNPIKTTFYADHNGSCLPCCLLEGLCQAVVVGPFLDLGPIFVWSFCGSKVLGVPPTKLSFTFGDKPCGLIASSYFGMADANPCGTFRCGSLRLRNNCHRQYIWKSNSEGMLGMVSGYSNQKCMTLEV